MDISFDLKPDTKAMADMVADLDPSTTFETGVACSLAYFKSNGFVISLKAMSNSLQGATQSPAIPSSWKDNVIGGGGFIRATYYATFRRPSDIVEFKITLVQEEQTFEIKLEVVKQRSPVEVLNPPIIRFIPMKNFEQFENPDAAVARSYHFIKLISSSFYDIIFKTLKGEQIPTEKSPDEYE